MYTEQMPTVAIVKTSGYSNSVKVSLSINGSEAVIRNTNTYHPRAPVVLATFDTANPRLLKSLILQKYKKNRSSTSRDWIEGDSKQICETAEELCSTIENLNICIDCKKNKGTLICCDGCIRSYHASCIGLREVPSGKWYCGNCHEEVDSSIIEESNKFDTIAADSI